MGIIESRYGYGRYILNKIYIVRWVHFNNILKKLLYVEVGGVPVWYDIDCNKITFYCLLEDCEIVKVNKLDLYKLFGIGYVLVDIAGGKQ